MAVSSRSVLLLMLTSIVTTVHSYGTGAGISVCNGFLPGHRVPPQTSESPYKFKVNAEIIDEEGTVAVMIEGSGFAGFYIAATDSLDDSFVGYFSDPPVSGAQYKIGPCTDTRTSKAAGATHINQNTKSDLTMTWNSPPNYSGIVCFRGAVAEGFSTFWGPLISPCVRVGTPATATDQPVTTPTLAPAVSSRTSSTTPTGTVTTVSSQSGVTTTETSEETSNLNRETPVKGYESTTSDATAVVSSIFILTIIPCINIILIL